MSFQCAFHSTKQEQRLRRIYKWSHAQIIYRFIDEKDKPAIYSGASVFVFPSLYEGFGLTPLEAMSCGTPVVCSNRTSLPEVVGDAAISIDPDDTKALIEAMYRVLTDS